MKVAVTGANGFIGRAVCHGIREAGHDLVPLVRRQAGLAGEVVVPDLCDGVLATVLAGCDAVVHLAGHSGAGEHADAASRRKMWSANVDASRAVAQSSAKAGVRRIVFVSSAKVLGEISAGSGPIPEDSPPRPTSAYAQSKLAAEGEIAEACARGGTEFVIVRPTVVYGPGVGGNILWLTRLAKSGIPLPLGAVANGRSLVALENLVAFLMLCADPRRSPAAASQAFVVSDGHDVSTPELLRALAKAYDRRSLVFPLPVSLLALAARAMGKGPVAQRVLGSFRVESAKAHRLLGWRPVISMADQFKKMAEHDSNS